MTGTATTEAEEFHKIYKLDVVSIPTNRPMIRDDKQDLIFLTKNAKYKAIVDDVKERQKKGQPILIGTIAIETSEYLSAKLTAASIRHEVLNAKQHAREAEIVAHAGEAGCVTIATNMAGRGTDIKLTPESRTSGGLYILGTERHESRRIDNQLRGRSGRQGDPGESRFYLSLEDDLIRIFSGDWLKKNMERFGMVEDEIIESKMVSRTIEHSQEKVEKHNFDIRKHLLEYDDVLNQQRTVVYQYRRSILEGAEQIYELIRDMIDDTISLMCEQLGDNLSNEQYDSLLDQIRALTGLSKEDLLNTGFSKQSPEALRKDLINFLLKKYELYRNQQNSDIIKDAEKWLMLETIDQAWKQHMLNIDHLKEGISLRSWGQKNPLIEYKREAFEMFKGMMDGVRAEIVHHIFHLNMDRFNKRELEAKREHELNHINMMSGAIAQESGGKNPVQKKSDTTGRNEDCPCGSGKKFKKCHGK